MPSKKEKVNLIISLKIWMFTINGVTCFYISVMFQVSTFFFSLFCCLCVGALGSAALFPNRGFDEKMWVKILTVYSHIITQLKDLSNSCCAVWQRHVYVFVVCLLCELCVCQLFPSIQRINENPTPPASLLRNRQR